MSNWAVGWSLSLIGVAEHPRASRAIVVTEPQVSVPGTSNRDTPRPRSSHKLGDSAARHDDFAIPKGEAADALGRASRAHSISVWRRSSLTRDGGQDTAELGDGVEA
jgi:hypothetical protein